MCGGDDRTAELFSYVELEALVRRRGDFANHPPNWLARQESIADFLGHGPAACLRHRSLIFKAADAIVSLQPPAYPGAGENVVWVECDWVR